MSEFTLPPAYDLESLLRAYAELKDRFENLPNVFVSGRVIERVPVADDDTVAGEFIGDTVDDGAEEYKLVDVAGTPTWRKTTGDISWP